MCSSVASIGSCSEGAGAACTREIEGDWGVSKRGRHAARESAWKPVEARGRAWKRVEARVEARGGARRRAEARGGARRRAEARGGAWKLMEDAPCFLGRREPTSIRSGALAPPSSMAALTVGGAALRMSAKGVAGERRAWRRGGACEVTHLDGRYGHRGDEGGREADARWPERPVLFGAS